MSGSNGHEPRPGGFEYDGTFYPLQVMMNGKALRLMDRITGGMPPAAFIDETSKPIEEMRAPVFLTTIVLSIMRGNPEWSLERLLVLADEIDPFNEVEFLPPEDDAAEDDADPPAGDGAEATPAGSSTSSRSPGSRSRKRSGTPR